jgi:outer membrane protein, multidrug efflux system
VTRRIVALLAVAALGGCSMAPAYRTPALPVPATWPAGDAYLLQTEAALPSYSYRDVFADPRLRAVLDQALAGNQNVAIAIANIETARAQFRIQRSELFPQVDATGSYRRTKGAIVQGGNALGSGNGVRETFNVQGMVSAWEIDVFGRIASLTGAARERYLASEAAARGTRLTLVADVAEAWIAYGRDRSLLDIAARTAEAAAESVRLTQRRLDGGIAPRSDLRQAQIVLETARADVASQTTLVAQDRNALELLVGAPVDPANLPISIEDAAARLSEVPAGLDSTILLRRPDVLDAEFRLRAANAEIGAARAALFPRISLTGMLGFASDALGTLFDDGHFIWQGGGNAGYSIFQAGAARAGVAQTEAQRDAALAAYRLAVQSAFADVADTLARRGTIDAQLRSSRSGREASADNLHLAELRYRGGVDSYLQELSARQALYDAERGFANTQQLRASNLIALYRSLGGDRFGDPPTRAEPAE